jgi:hypothetical protein
MLALAVLLSCWFAFPAGAQQKTPPPEAQQQAQPAPVPPVPQSTVEGTVRDAVGQPVANVRVVAREKDGVEAFVSVPSDEEGWYFLAVPANGSYVVVALISPTGGRVAMPESEPLRVGSAKLQHDVQLPLAMGPTPRKNGVDTGGAERLFLMFVEDPALVDDPYLEGRVDFADYGSVDTLGVDLIFATPFGALPRIEWGLAGGFANVSRSGGSDESGARDLDLWGKFAFYRSANNRTDMAFGALLTLPTGDDAIGLGRDALQSKLFYSASYAFRDLALIGSVGVRVTGDGMIGGLSLDGAVSGTAAIGVSLPLWHSITLTTELDYQSERFDGFGEESRVAFGVDWRIFARGVFRGAVIGGLVDDSADARIVAGFGYSF